MVWPMRARTSRGTGMANGDQGARHAGTIALPAPQRLAGLDAPRFSHGIRHDVSRETLVRANECFT